MSSPSLMPEQSQTDLSLRTEDATTVDAATTGPASPGSAAAEDPAVAAVTGVSSLTALDKNEQANVSFEEKVTKKEPLLQPPAEASSPSLPALPSMPSLPSSPSPPPPPAKPAKLLAALKPLPAIALPDHQPASGMSTFDVASRDTYIDPTPLTPLTSNPPSRSPSQGGSQSRRSSACSPARSDTAFDERRYMSDDEQETGSRTEIQSIMKQFSEAGGGPGEEEVMSPRLEIAAPMLTPVLSHPPRKSSLEPLVPSLAQHVHTDFSARDNSSESGSGNGGNNVSDGDRSHPGVGKHVLSEKATDADSAAVTAAPIEEEDKGPPVPPKDIVPLAKNKMAASTVAAEETVESPLSPMVPLHRPPPPEPEPEPALPFDFHRFLEQLRNRRADPIARYLKSFLSEFGKRQWMVHEQVKIISDFLTFIDNKMAVCDVWRNLSDAEFDNAREGMEKLVMNRLYTQTFSPAIPPPQPLPGARPANKRRGTGSERFMGPGRRGQHQEDVERDEVLAQKINIYGWIREEHLDIPPVGESGKRFLKLAQQELLKIKSYRAPRDKIICVLNCCKVIFGLLKHAKSDSSADSFMPLLIYVVLQANPEHLVSNVQYILRFRNQEKLSGEAGYYLSSLMGAIQFIENMDRTTLTISDEEFEKNVEAAVSAIAEKHRADELLSPQLLPVLPPSALSEKEGANKQFPSSSGHGESSASGAASTAAAEAEAVAARSSAESDSALERPPRRSFSRDDEEDDKDAITGLLRTIQRPLTTIGRMFADEPASPTTAEPATETAAAATSTHGNSNLRVLSPVPPLPPRGDSAEGHLSTSPSLGLYSAEESAARQASAEAAEAQRLHRAEHANIVDTLAGMFPDLDWEIISDVVYQKEGRVGLAVDACLALSS